MNSKRMNRIVAIFNIISITTFYILMFSASYLASNIMSRETEAKSIYNSFIIETLLNNIQIIVPLMFSGIGIINIICAIQNKQNKKICFWQLVFGISYVWSGLGILMLLTDMDEDIIDWIDKIIFSIVPIILAMVNLALIKKHKPKIIQIISYIAVIILSILSLLEVPSLLEVISLHWSIIAVVMQLIYIHFQDRNIEESKSRKIVNILLYYVLQLILAVGFFVMALSSLFITKVNEIKWKNGLIELYHNVTTLKGSTDKELYIPVEKNYKYGFINENGQEKISCQYDKITYFNEIEINNSTYYIALAKKDNKFYIISKSNSSIELNGVLEKYMQTIDNYLSEPMTSMFNFEFSLQTFTREEANLNTQTVETNNTNSIALTKKKSKYYYSNKNYSMIIEPIYEETDDDEDENTNGLKYNVTIMKSNGEKKSSIVYLPGLYEDDATLDTFTNGYIEFENEEYTGNGWYDSEGNQITIPNTYTIRDIKDNKVILQLNNTEDENYNENKKYEFHFLIMDMTGKILLQTTAIDIYDNMYLVKNANNKMVLMDKDLNVISNEYDKIMTTMQIDRSANYSSYY